MDGLLLRRPVQRVLNAFRRHRLGHRCRRSAAPCDAGVLNAFRRHRLGHALRPATDVRCVVCSTPFGVTDLVTRRQRRALETGLECSTPFGVTDLVTAITRAARSRPATSAQRLSASQTWSPAAWPRAARVVECSTPFGVTDLVTGQSRPRSVLAAEVLNAFRRHRLGHQRVNEPPAQRGGSAQRLSASQTWSPVAAPPDVGAGTVLNAFRRHRLGHADAQVLHGDAVGCAQRLSASQTWSLADRGTRGSGRRVLNAFRRHRLGHEQHAGDHRHARPVLNAFRRHRLGHRATARGSAAHRSCSTPFGVTDLVTRSIGPASGSPEEVLNASRRHRLGHGRSRGQSGAAQRVLNASRRHRLGHPSGRVRAIGVRCSTPLGVTDLVTDVRADAHAAGSVCSTPLGVTDLVTPLDGPSTAAPTGAQRLSASQTWSRVVADGSRGELMCSTPLGVTDLVTAGPCSLDRVLRGCSTPLGVTDLVTPSERRAAAGGMCSTPLGVTDLVTTFGDAAGCRKTCAQRLSASQTWSQRCGRFLEQGRRVLNASRRHRLGHSSAVADTGTWTLCSTPLGVTDLVTPTRPARLRRGPSAQRLSASQTWSRRLRRRLEVRAGRCSTPLGVTDLVTASPSRLSATLSACSTPLGVTDLVTLWRGSMPAAGGCSTPLGVTDLVTRRQMRHQSTQRLCSTPLGVTDLVTGSAPALAMIAWSVLNASRRHRLGHPVGLGRRRGRFHRAQRLSASQTWSRCSAMRPGSTGRQVLNASRRHRLGHACRSTGSLAIEQCSTPLGVTDLVTTQLTGGMSPRRGAQRLSASQTWSLVPTTVDGSPSSMVLNASRRHRLGHLHEPIVEPALQGVLNASRRHRLGHTAAMRRSSGGWYRCSTPLGVTDLVTQRTAGRSRRRAKVLNASRRHRLGHASRGASGRRGSGSAQRLSASQTWSRRSRGDTQGRREVLNASRRHRLGHAANARVGRDVDEGAQRLSASQTWSRA